MSYTPQVSSETLDLFGLPALVIYPKDRLNLPLVFFIHGFGGNRENGRELGILLAQKGFFFISVDAYFHGGHKEPGAQFPGLFNIIQHTSDDIAKTIERLQRDPRIDTNRVGVIGVSLGGLTAFRLAAEHRNIAVTISILGNPDFEAHFRRLTQRDAGLKWVKRHNPSLWEVLMEQGKSMNPVTSIQAFYPRALLMLNGTLDEEVPMKHAAKFYQTLQPLYAGYPEKLSFQTFETGHEVTPDMNRAAVEWIRKYL